MQERHKNRDVYFNELARNSREYLVPFLELHAPQIFAKKGVKILEVGCGDGGNILPFVEMGMDVTGVDILEQRISEAQARFVDMGFSVKLYAHDILTVEDHTRYDLILIRDVIEHIYDKQSLLVKLQSLLADDGVLFVGFPAWQMPFGGHQQVCECKMLSWMPFFHTLPRGAYELILNLGGESQCTIDELLDIKRCGLTIERFEKLVNTSDLKIINRQLWFINPHYKIKFGLKPRLLSPFIGHIPYFRNIFSTTCCYLLNK